MFSAGFTSLTVYLLCGCEVRVISATASQQAVISNAGATKKLQSIVGKPYELECFFFVGREM